MLPRALATVPFLLGATLVAVLVAVWSARFVYPFDLEWMEGGMLAHSWQLQARLPLYPDPNPDFIPFVYPPGYASLVAILGGPLGLGYGVGRALSLFGTALAALALLWMVWRQTGDRGAGFLAACVFLGAFPSSGGFYDLVRPDALFVGLLAWSIALSLERRPRAAAAAGLMLAAATICKHNALAFIVPLAFGIWLRSGARAAYGFAMACAVPVVLLTAFMHILSDGNFLAYLVEVPASHPRDWARLWPGLTRELGSALPVALATLGLWAVWRVSTRWTQLPPAMVLLPLGIGVALGTLSHHWDKLGHGDLWLPLPAAIGSFGLGAGATAVAMALGAIVRGARQGRRLPWRFLAVAAIALTAVATSGLMRAHYGGYLNVYIPLHWCVAAGFGGVLARMRASGPAGFRLAWVAASAQLALQLGSLDHEALTPTQKDFEGGRAFVRAIRQYHGRVLSPYAAWMPVQAGKAPSLHLIGLWDLNHEAGPFYDEVATVRAAIQTHYWAAAVEGSKPFGYGLTEAYRDHKTIPLEKGQLDPTTGWQVKPKKILVPRSPGSSASP